MKKIYALLLTFFVIQNIKAQDNWITDTVSGLGTSGHYTALQTMGGKLYMIAQENNNGVKMFSSPTGAIGSFVEETSVYGTIPTYTVLSGSGTLDITSVAIDSTNNYLFMGTNSISSNSYLPAVYKFSGGTTVNTGTIPYASSGVNAVINYNTPKISALSVFNGNVYAFITAGFSTNISSIWRQPVAGGAWTNAVNFSAGSKISTITDAVVYHNRLYISVNCGDSAASSSYYYPSKILSTSDGTTWDTVGNIIPYFQSKGILAPSNSTFNRFDIHNDTLLIGLNEISTNFPSILYTTATGSAMPVWNSYMPSHIDSSTTSYGIYDIKSAMGKLWLYNGNGDPYYKGIWRYKNKSINSSTSPLQFSSLTPIGSGKMMAYFNNSMYAIQNPYSGADLCIKLSSPVAAFTDSIPNGLCTGMQVNFYNSSANAGYYVWHCNNKSFYDTSCHAVVSGSLDASPFSVTFNKAGTYHIKLYAYSTSDTTSLCDTITKTLVINQSPTIDTMYTNASFSTPYTYTLCQGQPVVLTASISPTYSNYVYQWVSYIPSAATQTVTGNGSTTSFTTMTVSSPISTGLTVTNPVTGCSAYSSESFMFYINMADSLSGIVKAPSGSLATKGRVYLFKQKSNHVGVADSTGYYTLAAMPKPGYFTFANTYYGDYYLQASLDTTQYPTSINTYYTHPVKPDAYQWDSATVIQHHTCASGNDTLTIQVEQIVPTVGTGTISGTVYQDASYGHRMAHGGNNSVMGVPLRGIGVSLGKVPGGGCAARTATNNSGSYTFTNLGIGSYRIFVDIPNYGMDSVRMVTITAADTVSINNDYHVDSVKIYVGDGTTGIFTPSISNNANVKVYPNPAGNVAYVDFYNNQSATVAANLYDLNGNLISVLANEKMAQGTQSIRISLVDLKLSAGVYMIRANINNSVQNFKLTVIPN
ncbi:MAG: carboxypeptidase regulatory-like domain-containing protein [Bacteroidetes bacterium]|nr:carboxypeptidase regulatory-like domain-containing protein [Bacteroidota bacterium]